MKTANETGRLAISFSAFLRNLSPGSMYPLSEEAMILLVQEQPENGPAVWSVAAEPQWRYSALGAICRQRATLAEKGQLLVDGKPLKAEKYLALWRAAAYQPLELVNAVAQGFVVQASFSLPTAYLDAVLNGVELEYRLQAYLLGDNSNRGTSEGDLTTWLVPLDGQDNLTLYARLVGAYVKPGKYGQEKTVAYTVHEPQASAQPAATAQARLFSEAV